MKTTIELPDKLLAEAKALAVRRRTTLKAMMEHALRREIRSSQPVAGEGKCFTIDEHGLPMVRKVPGTQPVTSELVYKMIEDLGI